MREKVFKPFERWGFQIDENTLDELRELYDEITPLIDEEELHNELPMFICRPLHDREKDA